MQKNFLQKVMAERRKDAVMAQKNRPWPEMEQLARQPRSRRSLFERLQAAGRQESCIIAEIKKASPSAGCLRADITPAQLARQYAQAGATAISVLTEPRYFMGSEDDFKQVRQAVDLPILRKDFISEPYQVAETAAMGADVMLLIAAALEPARLQALYSLAISFGLDVLVEVHQQEELEIVANLERAILGVNCRNLKTLATDLDVTRNLAAHLPTDRPCIAESGIRTREQIMELQCLGYKGFLIGETLMRAPDPGQALRNLLY